MKPLIALVPVTLVLSAAAALVPAAAADVGVGDDWTVGIVVPDTSWDAQFLPGFAPCNDLKILVSVGGTAIGPETKWTLTGEVRAAGSPEAMEEFTVDRLGPASFEVTGVQICEHFNAPVPGPWGEYEVLGTAIVPTSTTPSKPVPSGAFSVAPLRSDIGGMSYLVISGVNTIRYWVYEYQDGGFFRRVSGGAVVVEQLVAGVWTKIGDATFQGDGVFTLPSSPPAGSWVRGSYLGNYSVAPRIGMPLQVQSPSPEFVPSPVLPPVVATPGIPAATVKIKAVSARSKLKVDVNPNMGAKYWTFQVQRRNADGTWKALKTYRTRGTAETRTLDLRKGTYRVWVNPKFGHLGVMSPNTVTLKR
jgi:hypothetical protein